MKIEEILFVGVTALKILSVQSLFGETPHIMAMASNVSRLLILHILRKQTLKAYKRRKKLFLFLIAIFQPCQRIKNVH